MSAFRGTTRLLQSIREGINLVGHSIASPGIRKILPNPPTNFINLVGCVGQVIPVAIAIWAILPGTRIVETKNAAAFTRLANGSLQQSIGYLAMGADWFEASHSLVTAHLFDHAVLPPVKSTGLATVFADFCCKDAFTGRRYLTHVTAVR